MIDYKDPLFGIIALLSIIILVILIDMARNYYRKQKKHQALQDLTKSYEFVGLQDGVAEFLKISKNPIPTLEFIAKSYIQSGNVQEAIKVYLSMLESVEKQEDKISILEQLGIAYFSAGFLHRAKNIFLEILKNYPKNIPMLSLLLKTYESLGEYKNALDSLECIDELYEIQKDNNQFDKTFNQYEKLQFEQDLVLNKAYLNTLLIINDSSISIAQKIKQLEKIKSTTPKLEKIILLFFFNTNRSLFWGHINHSCNVDSMIDILWSVPKDEVAFDRILNEKARDVYRAKGYIADDKECEKFELENMRLLRRYCSIPVTMTFEYQCNSCKHIAPFENHRCAQCAELLNYTLICKIKKADEASFNIL